jgi:hypothetical protein|tara:strand:+ start:1111 stop:1323 length:213 start_codon:yes stop_codon:yes gene_type:complete
MTFTTLHILLMFITFIFGIIVGPYILRTNMTIKDIKRLERLINFRNDLSQSEKSKRINYLREEWYRKQNQ